MAGVKQFDRDEILVKAMQLFWKKGFHATSMQDLVNHLGINRASLYDTYGDKRALFELALNLYRENYRKLLNDQINSGKPFLKVMEQMLSQINTNGCFMVNTTTELAAEDPEIQKLARDNRKAFEKICRQAFKKEIDAGRISSDKDPAKLSSILFLMYNGIQVIARMNPSEAELKKLTSAILSEIQN